MKKIVPLSLLLCIPLSLFGSKILSYNIYDRTNRVDLMLTFDTPYTGSISEAKRNGKVIIKLQDASIESPKIKNVHATFLNTLTITPLKNKVQVVANVPKSVRFIASKTVDGYGLRLRFVPQNILKTSTTPNQDSMTQQDDATANTQEPLGLPTKAPLEISTSYIIVVALLLISVIALLIFKKRIAPTQKTKKTDSWLFQPNENIQQQASPEPQVQPQHAVDTPQTQSAPEVSIRFQKPLDAHNSVILLEYGVHSYLVLMGNGNILLDKFLENKPNTQEEFDTLLQNRHAELEAFLEGKNEYETPTTLIHDDTFEALQSYKEKAASSVYDTV